MKTFIYIYIALYLLFPGYYYIRIHIDPILPRGYNLNSSFLILVRGKTWVNTWKRGFGRDLMECTGVDLYNQMIQYWKGKPRDWGNSLISTLV